MFWQAFVEEHKRNDLDGYRFDCVRAPDDSEMPALPFGGPLNISSTARLTRDWRSYRGHDYRLRARECGEEWQ